MKRLSIVGIVMIVAILFSACSQESASVDPTAPPEPKQVTASPIHTTPPPKITDNPPVPVNIEELKQSIISFINNEVWYFGEKTLFYIEPEIYDIDIYVQDNDPYQVVAVFDELINYNYTAIGFMRSDRESWRFIYSFGMLYDKMEDILEDLSERGYSFYMKSEVRIEDAVQPVYGELKTGDKAVILQDIEDRIITLLTEDWGKTGDFALYVRDFNDNDYETYAIVEDMDSTDSWWIRMHLLTDTWGVLSIRYNDISEMSEYDYLQDAAVKVKKTLALEKVIHLD